MSAENSAELQSASAADLTAARTETVSVTEPVFTESLRIAEEIGKVKMAQAISSGLSLSIIRWFAAMRENKTYRKAPVMNYQGRIFRPSTFEELCEGMGFSKSSVFENLQNFAALGERCLTEAQELGLKVRDLRKALKDAPEDRKREVFAALRSVRENTPEDLKTALDVICAQLAEARAENKKLAAQTERLKKAGEDLRKDYDARGKVLESRNAQFEELNEKYLRATSPHPSDVVNRQLIRNAAAREELDKKCSDALLAVAGLAAFGASVLEDESMEEGTAAYVHQRISLAVKSMAAAILDNGIDVDLTAEFTLEYGDGEGDDAASAGTDQA